MLAQKRKVLFLLILTIALGSGLASLSETAAVVAQSNENPWVPLENLSRSGSSDEPRLIVDSDDQVHVLWKDEFEGFMYTRLEEEEWTEPLAVEYPFANYSPTFVSSPNGLIHAFWIDLGDQLWYSRNSAENLSGSAGWSPPQVVVESSVGYDVQVDTQGRLHLAYIRQADTVDLPAGVYYKLGVDNGANWRSSTLLYASRYLRALTTETSNVHLSLDARDDEVNLYVTWGNPLLNRIFLSRSTDSGENWSQPFEVDGPRSGESVGNPISIQTYPQGPSVLLTWQVRLTDNFTCVKYYQVSTDSGETWSEQKSFLDEVGGCFESSQFLQSSAGPAILFTVVSDKIMLLGWDGETWSNLQPQIVLAGFRNPDNLETVNLSCLQVALVNGQQLFVVGCDTNVGRDIWTTNRYLDGVAEWFGPESGWGEPVVVSGQAYILESLSAVADNEGVFHVVWEQPILDEDGIASGGEAVYYARFEDGEWLLSNNVVGSPTDKNSQPAIAIDQNGRILIAWSAGLYADLYFSWAKAERAFIISEWERPQLLPSIRHANSSPDILVDEVGNVYIVYAIPLNEDRGIYLTQSADGGSTWSEPVKVVDAVAREWEMVDQPRLSITRDGAWHLLFSRLSLSEGGSTGIYYTQSGDGGRKWSAAEQVFEGKIGWSEITGVGGTEIHRFWQGAVADTLALWHEVSNDGGLTWQRSTVFSRFGSEREFVSFAPDTTGGLHLLLMEQTRENWRLRYWVWRDGEWTMGESLTLDAPQGAQLASLDAAFALDGRLGVVYSARQAGIAQDTYYLYFIERSIELPELVSTPRPLASATPTEAPTSIAMIVAGTSSIYTPTVSPIQTPNPDEQEPGRSSETNISPAYLAIAGFLVGLVGLVVWISLRRRQEASKSSKHSE